MPGSIGEIAVSRAPLKLAWPVHAPEGWVQARWAVPAPPLLPVAPVPMQHDSELLKGLEESIIQLP